MVGPVQWNLYSDVAEGEESEVDLCPGENGPRTSWRSDHGVRMSTRRRGKSGGEVSSCSRKISSFRPVREETTPQKTRGQ